MSAAIGSISRPSGSSAVPFFAVMLTMGGYMSVGRFLVDLWRRRCTQYWVTNQRVVIRDGMFRPTTTSMSLQGLPTMVVTEGRDGVGTIKFGETPKRWGLWSAEYQGIYWPGVIIPTQFERIPHVRSVHDAILSAQREYRT